MAVEEPFEDQAPTRRAESDFVLDLDGFEGPIDVLLALARRQKVDLARISILELAEQYLRFIAAARRLSLEMAADYLVMAAWLAYLKSRLLLPEDEAEEDRPSAPELAEALALQLRRLDAMRRAGARILARPQLGRDVFARAEPEGFEVVRRPVFEATLFELLKAYGDTRRRGETGRLTIEPPELYGAADAIARLRGMMGGMTEWRTLMSYLPPELAGRDGAVGRSAVASTFLAALELGRSGALELRQTAHMGPIYVRRGPGAPRMR